MAMTDATYSRVDLHDLGDAAEVRSPRQTADSSSSSTSVGREKAESNRTWRENLTRENLLRRAVGVKKIASDAVPIITRGTTNALPLVKAGVRTREFRRHACAFLIFFLFGLLPLIVYFTILYDPFVARPVQCDSPATANATYGTTIQEHTPGIEGLFTIDRVGGKFPFWVAKLLDTLWDLFVARGMQFLAGWVSYIVFSNALLRTIEASPIPYRTFTGITLNGASAWTVIALLSDLRRYSQKRPIWLFGYGALALSYVLAMPTLLSTMTGYISASAAYTKVPGTSQFVPTSFFESSYTFKNIPGIKNSTCLPQDSHVTLIAYQKTSQYNSCNSTCVTHVHPSLSIWRETGESNSVYDYRLQALFYSSSCLYFKNETYSLRYGSSFADDEPSFNCNDTINIVLDGKNVSATTALDFAHKNYEIAYCYNNTGYSYSEIQDNGRCLPDTDHEAGYRWGFSAMLTSIVLIAHVLWACSLYAIWLEAERGSVLLAAGHRLTQLRGALAVAATAPGSTGLRAEELLRGVPAGEVERLLTRRGAAVGVEVFEGEVVPSSSSSSKEVVEEENEEEGGGGRGRAGI